MGEARAIEPKWNCGQQPTDALSVALEGTLGAALDLLGQFLSVERETPTRTRDNLLGSYRGDFAYGEEWWQDWGTWASSPGYMEWYEECKTLADRFGLAPWVVVLLCLLKGYEPEKDIGFMVIEAKWPRTRVVTESTDPLFLRWLAYEGKRVGLYVVQRQGSFEMTWISMDYPQPDAEPLPPSSKPPAHVAFHMTIETPPGYPPEAARELAKKACESERELRRRLGYPARERLRTSPLVSMAEELRVAEGPLPSEASYDIMDKLYQNGDLGRDKERRNLIKSRRHRLRKRLVKPYQDETGSTE